MGKIANLKKKGKHLQGKLEDLFLADASMLESALEAMATALIAFCDEDHDKKDRFSQITIDIEEDQDQCRDDIIARIFGADSMVFSRPDRMRMVTAMDRIVGQAKSVVFDLAVYTPEKTLPELNIHIIAIAEQTHQIGKITNSMISQFFDNFDEAIESCIKINEARHIVRQRKLEFFKVLYRLKLPNPDFRFYAELMNNLVDVVNRMEHFADYIYGLIVKYSTF